jgi:hypothetical protein
MEDFYLEPERVHQALDRLVEFKVAPCEEIHRRFGLLLLALTALNSLQAIFSGG